MTMSPASFQRFVTKKDCLVVGTADIGGIIKLSPWCAEEVIAVNAISSRHEGFSKANNSINEQCHGYYKNSSETNGNGS